MEWQVQNKMETANVQIMFRTMLMEILVKALTS